MKIPALATPKTTDQSRRLPSSREAVAAGVAGNGWPQNTKLALAAVTVLAALARLPFLNKSFWLDEGSTIAIVRGTAMGHYVADSWSGLAGVLWSRELNMAAYYFLLRLWLPFGQSEAWIRLLSVILGVATIPLIYLLGKQLIDRRVGLMAALLLAIHGAHVGYSQEARGYALVVLLCSASYLAFLNGVEKSAGKYWVLYVLTTALAVYSHFFALLVVPAQLVSLYWLPRREVPWRRLVTSILCVGVLAVPAAVFVLTKNSGQLAWISYTWRQLPRVLSVWAGNPVALPVYLILWWAAARAWTQHGAANGRSATSWRYALVLSWLIVPLLIVLIVCAFKPTLEARYMLFCLPPAVLLAAAGFFQMQGAWRRRMTVATLALSLAGVGYTYWLPKEAWQGAAKYVVKHAQPGDAVVVVPSWSRWPMQYYWSRWAVPGVSDDVVEPNQQAAWVARAATTHDRVWLVAYTRRPDGFHETATLQADLASQYHLERQYNLKYVRVELYRKGRN